MAARLGRRDGHSQTLTLRVAASTPVSRVSDVRNLLQASPKGDQLLLSFSRARRSFYLLLG